MKKISAIKARFNGAADLANGVISAMFIVGLSYLQISGGVKLTETNWIPESIFVATTYLATITALSLLIRRCFVPKSITFSEANASRFLVLTASLIACGISTLPVMVDQQKMAEFKVGHEFVVKLFLYLTIITTTQNIVLVIEGSLRNIYYQTKKILI